MKSPIANQSLASVARMERVFDPTGWAVAAVAASLLLGGTAASAGQKTDRSVNIRPIEDFLEAQGKVYPPPFYMLTWSDPKAGLFMAVDYAGLAAQWLEEQSGGEISIRPEIDGTVIERPLPNGCAEVTVLCHTRNTDMGVAPLDDTLTSLFGHNPLEVLAGDEPALGDSFLKWVFINEAPGAPLPDLLVAYSEHPQNMIMLSIEANGTGPLSEAFGVPDGTPGRAQMTQVGVFRSPGMGATADGWPAEHIKLQVLGH